MNGDDVFFLTAEPWKDRILGVILVSASKKHKMLFSRLLFLCSPVLHETHIWIFTSSDLWTLTSTSFSLNLDTLQGSCGLLPP